MVSQGPPASTRQGQGTRPPSALRPGVTDSRETSQAERWGFKLQLTALSQQIKDCEFWLQAVGLGLRRDLLGQGPGVANPVSPEDQSLPSVSCEPGSWQYMHTCAHACTHAHDRPKRQ